MNAINRINPDFVPGVIPCVFCGRTGHIGIHCHTPRSEWLVVNGEDALDDDEADDRLGEPEDLLD